jgi:hypothetical protein
VTRYFERSPVEELCGPFSEWPLILCSACHGASIESDIERFESRESAAGRDDPDWEPAWQHGLFHGTLSCPRTPCGNRHVVAGQWQLENDGPQCELPNAADDAELIHCYSVNYIFPPLPFMNYPPSVPDKVRDPILSASLVLLSDASAAANRIRASVEVLLDCQGVRKFREGSRSKRLSTHARIEIFARRHPEAASQLMAVKWIGNAGSHERESLPIATVLDGLEHFALAIEMIYDSEYRDLVRRAALINRRGGKFGAARGSSVRSGVTMGRFRA